MSPTSVSTLLQKYNLRPRQGLGQNFLTDPVHLEKIVAAAELTPQDTVLEIGPGPGSLTRQLLAAAGQVLAVELDSGMVRLLREELGGHSNLTVIEADILATPLEQLVKGEAYKVVANLPFYITSAVLRHLLEPAHRPARIVVTVQKEVAERIVAEPGQMSILAVSVQFYGRPEIVHRIPAGAFYPPPNVDAAVLRIDTYPQPAVTVPDVDHFFRVVKAGFSQRRKQLKNSLAGGLRLPAKRIKAALAQAEIDPTRRAQTLSLAEWGRLARALESPD